MKRANPLPLQPLDGHRAVQSESETSRLIDQSKQKHYPMMLRSSKKGYIPEAHLSTWVLQEQVDLEQLYKSQTEA
jgi:hypothetical protein